MKRLKMKPTLAVRARVVTCSMVPIAMMFGSSWSSAQDMETFKALNRVTDELREAFGHENVPVAYASASLALDRVRADEHDPVLASMLTQVLAASAANLGRHELAVELWSQGGGGRVVPEIPEGTSAIDAVGAIVREAEGRRVVFLNEAHHMGRHREFARRLLKPLREQGFTHLACEAFTNEAAEGFEVDAGKLGYPTLKTGYYIRDPLFAEFVRTAVSLGFKLVAYETTDVRPPGSETPAQAVNRRDTDQANKLASVLRENPEARMLVYCGFSHLSENETQIDGEAVRWAAARVTSELSIDPLTVSQTGFLPSVSEGTQAASDVDGSYVLKGRTGLWSSDPDRHDIEVLHPEAGLKNGRPGWFAPDRLAVRVEVDEGTAAVIAMRTDEGDDAVPSDVVYLSDTTGADPDADVTQGAVLMLLPGEYSLWGVDAEGERVLIRMERVE